MSTTVDIKRIDKIVLLKELWKKSRASSLLPIQKWNEAAAKEAVKGYINNFAGRPIKTNLNGDIAKCDAYDKECKEGSFQRIVNEVRSKTIFEDYSGLIKQYDKPEYKNNSMIKYLLKYCKEYNECFEYTTIKIKTVDQIQTCRISDINALLGFLETAHIIDTKSGNIIKALLKLRQEKKNDVTNWLLSICKIDGIPANDSKIKSDTILSGPESYFKHFKYDEKHTAWLDGAIENKPYLNAQLFNILINNEARIGGLIYSIPINIFLGFILFDPIDVTIKLLEEYISQCTESLDYYKRQVNYYKQRADKYIKLADQISILGLAKYIETIKNNMFALQDAEEAKISQAVLAVLNTLPNGMEWLKKDGQADSASEVFATLRAHPTIQNYLGLALCSALADLRIAYQIGIPFFHKLIIAKAGIAWDSFTIEEAIAFRHDELAKYIRDKKSDVHFNLS